MTPEEWQRIRPLLESALELKPEARSGFLDGACQDASVRHEVESLLASHEEAGTGLLESPPASEIALEEELRLRLPPGKRVGAYQIVREIAQGGMGAVYQAVRADGQYKQRVALKIVRSEFGGEFTAARFRNERQILASLDHANIAKILDGGTTADGVPFFVMEFIDGLPITEYCDQHKLTVNARLELFRTVCAAVHYAHQHLVVHRDIKPSNILVTPDGVPKLLDFGIAKLLNPNLLPEHLTLTAGGFSVMTPEYASPEQLSGGSITTATDVYSLGLVLYELLAGRRAFRFASPAPHEVAKVVLETDPEKPSAASAREEKEEETIIEGPRHAVPVTPQQISSLRSEIPDKLRRRLSGDLDNIVLKALRKEVSNRYSSADQLSEDIRRHLEGLPILARKSSVAYRCRKYVQRHKVVVAAAALIFASLLTGLFLTLREARIARANELRAEKRFNDVRALANSLIWEVHDSIQTLPGATKARKLIMQRAQEYLDSLAAESKSDPTLLRELAAAYQKLGNVLGDPRDANVGNSELAMKNFHRSIELREAVVAAAPNNQDYRRELGESYLAIAAVTGAREAGNPKEVLLEKGRAILEPMAAANPEDPRIQYDIAKAFEHTGQGLAENGKWDAAKPYYEKSLVIYKKLADADPKRALYTTEVGFAHKHLGGILIQLNQLPAALAEYQASLAIDEAQLNADPQNVLRRYTITFSYSDIGYILGKEGDINGALGYYRKVLAIRSALAAEDPQDTKARAGMGKTYTYIAALLEQKGDLQGALENDQKALALREALYKSDTSNTGKREEYRFSQVGIGSKYTAMAFQPRVPRARKVALCRQAESWFDKGLPEFRQNKNELVGGDANFIAQAEQEATKCNAVLAKAGQPAQTPAKPNAQ